MRKSSKNNQTQDRVWTLDKIAFHRSFAVSGGLALLRAFCLWKIEYQLNKCHHGCNFVVKCGRDIFDVKPM